MRPLSPLFFPTVVFRGDRWGHRFFTFFGGGGHIQFDGALRFHDSPVQFLNVGGPNPQSPAQSTLDTV